MVDSTGFLFELLGNDAGSFARRGRLVTPHGVVQTPAFMPVGTIGAMKGLTPVQLAETGSEIMLSNTYHLALRPTPGVVEGLGGLHRFTGWDRPILTDSGGFQVFSLAKINRIDDDGVDFRSHIDGSLIRLTPEIATDIQNRLGADIIMAFDQCPPLPCDPAELTAAVDRTIAWAKRCRAAHSRSDQWQFGIVQGGVDHHQRRICAEQVIEVGFDGYAVGGLSVGESHEEMVDVLTGLCPRLPGDRPRYLMGVGVPRDLYAGVRAGIDMFDCVIPTRNGRHGHVFTATGPLKMRNERHRLDGGPLEEGCDCYACRTFSRGYLRHLFMAGEMLGPTLASIHNVRFLQRLMGRMRDLISTGDLATIPDEFPVVLETDGNDES